MTPAKVIDAALEGGTGSEWVMERLRDAGFVIVPRVATEAMAEAGFCHTGDPCWQESVKEAWTAMVEEWERGQS